MIEQEKTKHLEQDISESLWKNIREIISFFDMRKNLHTNFSVIKDKRELLEIYKEFLKQWAKIQLMLNEFHEQEKQRYSTRIKNILHSFSDKETLGTSGFNNLYMQGEIVEKYTTDQEDLRIHDILGHGTSEQLPEIEKFIDEKCDFEKDNFLIRRFHSYIGWTQNIQHNSPRTKSYQPQLWRPLLMGIFPFKKRSKKEKNNEDPYGFLKEGDELMKKLMELLKGYMIDKQVSHEKEENEEEKNKEIAVEKEIEEHKKENFEKVKEFLKEKILKRKRETNEAIKNTFQEFSKEEMSKLEKNIFKGELKNFFKNPKEKKIKEIIKTYSGLNKPKDKIIKGLRYLVRKYKVGLSTLMILTTVIIANPKLRELWEEKIKALWYRLTPTEIPIQENKKKLTAFNDDNEALEWIDSYEERWKNLPKELKYEKESVKTFIEDIEEKEFASLEILKEQWEKSTNQLFEELKKVEGWYLYNSGTAREVITPRDSIRMRDIIDTINISDIKIILDSRIQKDSIKYWSEVEEISKTITDGIMFYPLMDNTIGWISIDYSEENRKILMNTQLSVEEAQHTLIHELWHKVSMDNPYMFVTEWGNEYKVIKDSRNLLGKDYFGRSYTDAVIDYLFISHYYTDNKRHDKHFANGKKYEESGKATITFDHNQSMEDLLEKYEAFIKQGDTANIIGYEIIVKYRKLTEILEKYKNHEFDPLLIMYCMDKHFPNELIKEQKNNKIVFNDIELQKYEGEGFQEIFRHRWLSEDDFSPNGRDYVSWLWEKYKTSEFAEIEKMPLAQQIEMIDNIYLNYIGNNINAKSNTSMNVPSSGDNENIFSKLWNILFGDKKYEASDNIYDKPKEIIDLVFITLAMLMLMGYGVIWIESNIRRRRREKQYEENDLHNDIYEDVDKMKRRRTRYNRAILLQMIWILQILRFIPEFALKTWGERQIITESVLIIMAIGGITRNMLLALDKKRKEHLLQRKHKKTMKTISDPIEKNKEILEYNKKQLVNHKINDDTNIPFNHNNLRLWPIKKQTLKNMNEIFSRKTMKQKKDKSEKRHKRLREGTDSNMIIINTEDHQWQRINRYKTAGLSKGKLCIINETKKMELKNEVANNGQILVWIDLDFDYNEDNDKFQNTRQIEQGLNTIYNLLAQSKIYTHEYHKNIDMMVFRNDKLVDIIHLYGWSSNEKVNIKNIVEKYHNLTLKNYIKRFNNVVADYEDEDFMEPYIKDKKYDKIIAFGLSYDFWETVKRILDPEDKRKIEIMDFEIEDMKKLAQGEKIEE